MTASSDVVLEGRAIPPLKPVRRKKWTAERVVFVAICLGVPLAIFLVFVIVPFVQAAYNSLTDWGGFSPTKHFVGLQNYIDLWQDPTFMRAVLNCALLGVVVPFVTLVIALAIASVVTVAGPSRGRVRGVRAGGFYRMISFFPFCIPALVIGLIWSEVYDPSAGLLNGFLTHIGLHGFLNFPWLGEPGTAMPASMFVIIWGFIGFYTVYFVAAIKSVPAEMYEAARIDGAGRLRTAVSVTIPQVRDTIQTAYIYIGIAALDSFVYMSALFPDAGGPNNSTLVVTQELYNAAFSQGRFGLATAMGVVLALMTLIFAAIVFGVNRLSKGRQKARP